MKIFNYNLSVLLSMQRSINDLSIVFTTFAGTPTATESSGISLTTTAFAPIIEFFPMVTGPNILAPVPIKTFSPIVGEVLPPFFLNIFPPIVTPLSIVTFFPTMHFS
jgi:hypothetical protein